MTKENFNINDNGAWQGLDSTNHHSFDAKLANSLVSFFKSKNATSVIDFGAGMGKYAQHFRNNELFVSCYDGNPDTQIISNSSCAVLDLSKDINLQKHDWVLSLEVAEHLPKEFEDIFINNIIKNSKYGFILSWAIPGQTGDGHVNEQSNIYVRIKMDELGFHGNFEAEKFLRSSLDYPHFANTIMVFEPKNSAFYLEEIFFETALNNDVEQVSNLLSKISNINYRNTQGSTALYMSAQNSFLEIAEMLLKAGANTEIKINNGVSPLHRAVQDNNLEMAKLLLQYGADANTFNRKGYSALNIAVQLGYSEMAKLLLDAGADYQVLDPSNKNLIQIAAEKKYEEIFRILASKHQSSYSFNQEGIQEVALISMIKNEESIIFENLVWHFALGFRKFFIIDNLSTDKTSAIIHNFKKLTENQAKVFIMEDPIFEYIQSRITTGAYHFVRSVWPEVKWVFPIDADEFLIVTKPLLKMLNRVPDDVDAINLLDYKYHPVSDYYDFSVDAKFYDKIHYRDYKFVQGKVAVKPQNYIRITQGNNYAELSSEANIDKEIRYVYGSEIGLSIYEFQSRSIEQVHRKYDNGRKVNAEAKNKGLIEKYIGAHWDNYTNYINIYGDKAAEVKFNESLIDTAFAIDDPLPIGRAMDIFYQVTQAEQYIA